MGDSPINVSQDDEFSHDLDPEHIRDALQAIIQGEFEQLKEVILQIDTDSLTGSDAGEKTQAEILLMREEISALKRPWYRTPATLISILSALLLPLTVLIVENSMSKQELQIAHVGLVYELHETHDTDVRAGKLASFVDEFGLSEFEEIAHGYPREGLQVISGRRFHADVAAQRLRTDLMNTVIEQVEADFAKWKSDVENLLTRLRSLDSEASELTGLLASIGREDSDDQQLDQMLQRFDIFHEEALALLGHARSHPEWMTETNDDQLSRAAVVLDLIQREIEGNAYSRARTHLQHLATRSKSRATSEEAEWEQIVKGTETFLATVRQRIAGDTKVEAVYTAHETAVSATRKRPSDAGRQLVSSFDLLKEASDHLP